MNAARLVQGRRRWRFRPARPRAAAWSTTSRASRGSSSSRPMSASACCPKPRSRSGRSAIGRNATASRWMRPSGLWMRGLNPWGPGRPWMGWWSALGRSWNNRMALTLASWIEQFLAHLHYQRNASPHTLRNYGSDLYQFHHFLTHTASGDPRPEPGLDQIDNLTIREFLGVLYQRRNRRSSVARKLGDTPFLHEIPCRPGCDRRQRREECGVAETGEAPAGAPVRRDAVIELIETPEDENMLGARDLAILELFYATGIRVSELVGLD